jgi:Phage tail tube protein
MFADTNLRSLVIGTAPETVYAETPSTPAVTTMRSTGDTLAYNKTQVSSREIRSDRMVPSIIQTAVTVEGAVNIELSTQTYDALFEALLCGTWTSNVLKNSVTKRSFFLEKNFTDLVGLSPVVQAFIHYTGMRCVDGAMNFRAGQIIDGSFTFWGHAATISSATLAGSPSAATTNPSLSASADVGTVQYQGANIVDSLKDLALTISNTPRHRPIIGSIYDADIGFGTFAIRITGTALVSDLSMFTDVIAHNTVAIAIPVTDGTHTMTFKLPALKLSGNPDTPAGNQDVELRFTGEAFRDPTTTCMIEIDRT